MQRSLSLRDLRGLAYGKFTVANRPPQSEFPELSSHPVGVAHKARAFLQREVELGLEAVPAGVATVAKPPALPVASSSDLLLEPAIRDARRQRWAELTALLDTMSRRGATALTADQVRQVCRLYRQVTIDLSKARAEGDDPAAVLTKLTRLLNVGRDGNFATVLCGVIDITRHEVTLASAGHPYPLLLANGRAMSFAEASAMKLYSAQAAMETALEAVQLFGGNGYMSEYQVEQLCRDAKVAQIYAGTDEMQVRAIARDLLTR